MDATWLSATYENVSATCPTCGKVSIFNRASDLKSFVGITGQDVTCLNETCKATFRVIGDTINPAFEMFVYDSAELYQIKRYSLCIISLAQAWETFFANFLRLELAYRPYVRNEDQDQLNDNLSRLYEATKKWTFAPMRNAFLHMLIRPTAVPDIAALIAQSAELTHCPPEADLQRIAENVRGYATVLYHSKLPELRNQVAHKQAYRPTKDEVDQFAAEARETLIPLGYRLGVQGDDVNWYAYKLGPGSNAE